MPAGRVTYTIECVLKSPNSGLSTAPCVTVGANRYVPVMAQAYVVDASAAPYIDSIAQPFDYVKGSQFFGFALIFIVLVWWWSKAIKEVLDVVRRT